MIDNLLLEITLPATMRVRITRLEGAGRLHEVVQFDRVLGRNLRWVRAVGPGYWVGYNEDTHRCQIYLSVSRIHNIVEGRNARARASNLVNFPLHDFDDIDSMNLQPTCKRILWSLAQRVSSIGVDYVETLNLPDWIVRRVAYAVDVPVPHVLPTIGALASAQRKRTSEVDVRGRPGGLAHAATWTAGGVRIMLYSKGAELENRRAFSGTTFNDDKFGLAGRSRLREAAIGAKDMIRFEVTYLSLEGIRRLLGLDSPMAPTFRLMAHHSIGDYALGREIDRLRLGGLYCSSNDAEGAHRNGTKSDSSPDTSMEREQEKSHGDKTKSGHPADNDSSMHSPVGEQRDFRLIYDQFLAARAARCPGLSITRLGKVLTTYLLMTAFNRRELLQRGHKASSISKDLRDLDALGITMGDHQPSVDQQGRVESFVASLRSLLPDLRTDCPEYDKQNPQLVTAVPWAAHDESLVFKDARADFNQEFSDVLVEGGLEGDEGVAREVLASV